MATCRGCGKSSSMDRETGYDADDVCPSCRRECGDCGHEKQYHRHRDMRTGSESACAFTFSGWTCSCPCFKDPIDTTMTYDDVGTTAEHRALMDALFESLLVDCLNQMRRVQ
jgi:hypothetical protein